MGYDDQLTGHGIRGTLSTALNEIGYPKIWVDAQLSHSDPNKVSSAYNHAKHVEPRRRMMQDWADRLDLLEQGQVEAASHPYRWVANDGRGGKYRFCRGSVFYWHHPTGSGNSHRRDGKRLGRHLSAAVTGAAAP